jgi:formylmethanofuran dehydrogenase subunit E
MFKFKKCKSCETLIFEEDDNGSGYCDYCADYQYDCCEECGELLQTSSVTTADGRLICGACYNNLINCGC